MKKPSSPFLIGTSGWTYDSWKGLFYPSDLPKRDWLAYYATQFNTVELNATFYRLFQDETFIKWHDTVPRQFHYVVKVPRLITHRKFLKNTKLYIKKFYHSASLLDDKLGLILLQLSPVMPYDLVRLREALLTFPNQKKVVVEFRHEKWVTNQARALLEELGCIFCATDSPVLKLKEWVTSDIGYIRLHGHTHWYDYNYSKSEIQKIAKFAKLMVNQGAKTLYIFFNNDYYAYAPHNALYLKELLKS